MMDYINNNLSGFWIGLGFALLAAEVLLFGFGTIIFLFAGLGAVITGLLMSVGVVPETWVAGTASFGISTGISSAILWKPLMAMQNKSTQKREQTSDIVGLEFVLEQDIGITTAGNYRYSGMDWKVEIDSNSALDAISKGQRVVVAVVEVGLLRVVKK